MNIEVPLGDVVDRITILDIKLRKLDGPALDNVRAEHAALTEAWSAEQASLADLPEYALLGEVNQQLWDVEDALRDLERQGDFTDRFVALARSVYQLNDRRAALKRQVNERLGSRLVEEKSYSHY